MKSFGYSLLITIVAFVCIAAVVPVVARQLTTSGTITLQSHNVTELTITADKLITIHRALDVNTVLCIERQPTTLMWSSSNLVISGSVHGNVVEPKTTAPKEEIVPRVCMTVEKWLATGDAR